MQNKEKLKDNSGCENEQIELPENVQKRMLEFFLQTSIPRKKAMTIQNSLSEYKKAGE